MLPTSSDRHSLLCEEFPVLSSCLLPQCRAEEDDEDEETMDLVFRLPVMPAELGDLLESLRRLGQHPLAQASIRSVHLYKDSLVRLTVEQQTQLLETLGESLGAQITELTLLLVQVSLASLSQHLLRNMPRLEKLHLGRVSLLGRADAHHWYASLMNLKHLREFHWSLLPAAPQHTPLFQDPNAMDPLLLALSRIPTLRTVYLAAHLPGEGRIQSTRALQALSESTVTDLTLVHCPLSAEHVRALFTQGSRSFTSLALLQAEIGDAGADILAQHGLLAQGNPNDDNADNTLKKLFLPGNHLTDVGGNAIASALRDDRCCCRLEVLDVHDNRLTAAFGQSMSITLRQAHNSLTFLNVSYNPLRDAGGMALVAALAHNTQLSHLHMFHNQITDQTCAALAIALQANRQLKQVNLYHNPQITPQGVHLLLQYLEERNYVLERLDVSPMEDPQHTEEALDFLLTLNRTYGRKHLMSTVQDHLYFEKGVVKATEKNDLNSLFYFLKMKPTLCQQPLGQDCHRITSRQRNMSSQTIVRAALEACTLESCD